MDKQHLETESSRSFR